MAKRNHPISRKQLASRHNDLRRIAEGLKAAASLLPLATPAALRVERKASGDPVTSAEREVDGLLFKLLVRDEEGWLSEESADDLSRLNKERVWVVDPLDGTREYVSGIPEWCISIGMVEQGRAVAGGIYNPATDELFLGSLETNLTIGGRCAEMGRSRTDSGIVVLASRSEMNRGEWDRFRTTGLTVRPVGSVAYKLALVAAGCADATWTLVPKHEWDVAAGVALVLAAGGMVTTPQGTPLQFNRRAPLLEGLIAISKEGQSRLRLSFRARWLLLQVEHDRV
jgi:myo-inositol-1(or 4)-monophosphatase